MVFPVILNFFLFQTNNIISHFADGSAKVKMIFKFWDNHSYRFHVGNPENKICSQHQSKT